MKPCLMFENPEGVLKRVEKHKSISHSNCFSKPNKLELNSFGCSTRHIIYTYSVALYFLNIRS